MSSDKPEPPLERVQLASIAPGPVLRDKLSDSQLETARAIYAIVQPYFGDSFDAFELGFRRDLNPDRELRIWSVIAAAFQRFNEMYDAARDEEREAAFTSIVLLASMEPDPPPNIPAKIWEQCKQILSALPEYKRYSHEQRLEALEELAAQAQDLKLGY